MMINNRYLIYEVRAQTLGGETLPPESWILPTAAAQKDQVIFFLRKFPMFSSLSRLLDENLFPLQGSVLSRHGIFPQLKKAEKSDGQKATAQVSPTTSNPPEEKSEAASFQEMQSDRADFAKLNSANNDNGHNLLLPLDAQLVRKLWERRLILDAFSLENPSLASALLVGGHPSLASMMVESEGRSSRGQGGRLRGGIGTGEVRFPEEAKAEGEARFNLRMSQLEQLLDAQPVSQETFRR